MDKHNFFIEHLQSLGLNPNSFLLTEANKPWIGTENFKKVLATIDDSEKQEVLASAVEILTKLKELTKNQDFMKQLGSFEAYTAPKPEDKNTEEPIADSPDNREEKLKEIFPEDQ